MPQENCCLSGSDNHLVAKPELEFRILQLHSCLDDNHHTYSFQKHITMNKNNSLSSTRIISIIASNNSYATPEMLL